MQQIPLKLYQIPLKYLIETVDTHLIYAIISEVNLTRNYEMFTFKSIANRLNYLMNYGVIEGWTSPDNIPIVDPNSIEIYGVHPFRNKDHIFYISNEEAFIMIQRCDFLKSLLNNELWKI